jgi:hypothetical protein
MISSPLIHIGYHKTGSTWLQRELFNFDSDIFVPLAPRSDAPNAGKYLARYFYRSREKYLLSPFDLNTTAIMEELASLLEKIEVGNRIPVISDERLSGSPHSGGFDEKVIADRLHACFPDARIFCVIREQKDAILSTYYQFIRAGGTDSLSRFLRRHYDGNRPGFSPYSFRYVDLISYYRQLFTPERVLVLPYELFRDDSRAFLKRLGTFISVDLSRVSLKAAVVHNRKDSYSIASRCPFLNLFLKRSSVNGYSRLYLPLSRTLLNATGALLRLDSSAHMRKLKRQIEVIVGDRYIGSNRELSDLIGLDLSQYGYHD